jgi:DNA primase
MIDTFGLGYAPQGWDHLVRALRGRGFDAVSLEQAGLAVERQGGSGHYDALRDRVIFPIRDLQGRAVAFGGRALDGSMPKYLNSRETPLFSKGKTVYALDVARASIRESGEAVVVEGYMDAVACHQFGVGGAVASLGTALTLDQVLLLKRFASRAVLVYDADAAGADASVRGLELFDQAELPVRVAVLPGGTDPDSFLRVRGSDAFAELLERALPIFDYRLAAALRRHDPRTIEGKVGIVDEMSRLITVAVNPVRQAEYVRLLAERLGVREDAVRDELRRLGQRREPRRTARIGAAPPLVEAQGRAAAERLLLHLLVSDAGLRSSVRRIVTPEMFRERGHHELAEALLAPEAADDDVGRLRTRLQDETAVSLLSRFLIAEPPVKGDPYKVAGGCVQRLRLSDVEERIVRLMEAHGEAVRARDDARRDRIAVELTEARTEKARLRELKVSV